MPALTAPRQTGPGEPFLLWDVVVPADPMAGMTVVNDVVLTGTFQGKGYALDRKTGAMM